MTGLSLAPAQAICDRDVIAARWRQLRKTGGPERKSDSLWYWTLQDLLDGFHAHVHSEPGLRAALVELAATAVAAIQDLDNRAGDRAAVLHPLDQLEPVAVAA